jgi:hypothetical protein
MTAAAYVLLLVPAAIIAGAVTAALILGAVVRLSGRQRRRGVYR